MQQFLFLAALLAFCGTARSADFAPSLQWVKTAGGSGLSTATAAGTDAGGNLYIAGNTSSIDFPAVSAAQPNPGGSPLVRINAGTRAAQKLYPPGLSSIASIAADPRNSNTLYATSANTIWHSADAGSTWTLLYSFASSIRVPCAAVDPSNSDILYAGTDSQGVFKSTDGGLTWTAITKGIPPDSNGATDVYRIWIEPQQPGVILAASSSGVLRSADGGATWAVVLKTDIVNNTLAFDPLSPGTVYLAETTGPIVKSSDGGLTFTALPPLPGGGPATALIADPLHAGVLYAGLASNIFQSLDGGVTWTAKGAGYAFLLAADPNRPVLYADILNVGIVKSTDGFNTVSPAGPPNASLTQMLVTGENLLLVVQPSDDVFVLKLDPNGNIVYSTYFGGSGNDMTGALAMGADGSVYVGGVTESPDLPVTAGAYESSAPSPFTASNFILKLNPNGSLGWATYFADYRAKVHAIALDSAGNPYVSGLSAGG
ncbi:MAG TPA: sialidase family protein, partial [Candidatus Sulfopaludibacter sp.]|nr:sialidase family protein [Candidatus Sulfopaludibacter sp.]